MADEWRKTSSLAASLVAGESAASEEQYVVLLGSLTGCNYPVEGLLAAEVSQLLCDVVRGSPLHTNTSVPHLSRLVFSLVTTQKVALPQHVTDKLFLFFQRWLETAVPPTELLYLLPQLPTSQDTSAVCHSVVSMVTDLSAPIEVKRATLHCAAFLCERGYLTGDHAGTCLRAVASQLFSITHTPTDTVPVAKLAVSCMRAVSILLAPSGQPSLPSSLLSSLLPSFLPSLLTALKHFATIGLPGQPAAVAVIAPAAIPSFGRGKREKALPTVAGPQSPHKQSRTHRHRRPHPPSHPPSSSTSSPSSSSSSTSTSSSSFLVYSSSDSELSDSDPQEGGGGKGEGGGGGRVMYGRLRGHALTCLSTLFTVAGHKTTFSYWLSFFPDGPRLPHSPPSLLTCALRDPNHKCRLAALLVLCSLLEGSRPYLAAADDKFACGTLSFTPFSCRLGAVLRELHHQLLLALTTETHTVILTRAVRCLALLVANTPYQQLSPGYLGRVISTLHSLTGHKDTDVRVACLTCYGAVLSSSAPLAEVTSWLSATPTPHTLATPPPWLLQWTHSLLVAGGQRSDRAPSTAVQTEALQVLTAAVKFYFPPLRCHWRMIQELAFIHLSTTQQQHSLKLLEDLCRVIPEQDQETATELWGLLLSGPLTPLLQSPSSSSSSSSSICALACSVLATLGPVTMGQLQPSLRLLVLTLPLGLSRDQEAPGQVVAGAVRVLGVYCSFPCLKEDVGFLQDTASVILHSLTSRSQPVRVQASWALGNLTDSLLSPSPSSLSSSYCWIAPSYSDLLSAAVATLRYNDRVKCNGVRALGNLLRYLPEEAESKEMESVCSQLSHWMCAGTMKLRWNACYACHSAFSSTTFSHRHGNATNILLGALCKALSTCPNYKVRSHAALALGSLPSYTHTQLEWVWPALLGGLEASEHQSDFSEFQQVANLRAQLCRSMCHIVSLLSSTDMATLTFEPLSPEAKTHITEFSQRAEEKGWGELVVAAEGSLTRCAAAGSCNPSLQDVHVSLQEGLRDSSS